jgi:hypothetical protein
MPKLFNETVTYTIDPGRRVDVDPLHGLVQLVQRYRSFQGQPLLLVQHATTYNKVVNKISKEIFNTVIKVNSRTIRHFIEVTVELSNVIISRFLIRKLGPVDVPYFGLVVRVKGFSYF